MMTGLSLSFCVADIAAGLVGVDAVERIVASTAATTPEDYDLVIAGYRETYWRDNPDRCEVIARQLIAEGKVEQPRLSGGHANDVSDGHWLQDGAKVRLPR